MAPSPDPHVWPASCVVGRCPACGGESRLAAAPSPVGLSPLLDQLDEARAKATPGPWQPAQVVMPGYWGETDAALIVAAVNALPDLIRWSREREALREKVETVAAWCEEQAASRSHFAEVDPAYRNTVIPYEATAERLRDALTAALTPGADTADTHNHQNGEQ